MTKANRVAAVLLLLITRIFLYGTDFNGSSIYDYSREMPDLSNVQMTDEGLTLIDKYGTKIIFHGTKLSSIESITLIADNPCLVGANIGSTTSNATLSSTIPGFTSSNSGSFYTAQWISTPIESIAISSNKLINVNGIVIFYDLQPRLFVNGNLLHESDDVMRDDKIILRTFVEPAGPVRYQYSVAADANTPSDWLDVDADNGFSLRDFFTSQGINPADHIEFFIFTKVTYSDEVYGECSFANGRNVGVYYVNEDRYQQIEAPAAPTLDCQPKPNENNELSIDGDELTISLHSDEGTTIWYKVSDLTALKVRSRSQEIDESEYTDSQTNNKEITVTSNCELSYFSKHTQSGVNSEVTTLKFVKANDGASTYIDTLNSQSHVRYYDLSGKLLSQPPTKGIYIQITTNSTKRIAR